jgi:Helix-turn-helix domain
MRVYTEGQEGRPTLGEVAESRPPRGSGAPSRTRSHYDRILALLRERGAAGVSSAELYDSPHLYGRSPRNRVSEMRADGHLIQTVPTGASVVRYILTHENPSPTPRKQAKPAEQRPLRRKIEYQTATGKPRADVAPEESTSDDLPLFAGVR